MSWLATRNNDYSGCRFHIVTGPRINLAEELIDRIHSLFRNSKSGIVDCKTVGPIIYVDNAEEFENSITEQMVSHAWNLIRQYKLNDGINKVFIDGSQPGFIRSLK